MIIYTTFATVALSAIILFLLPNEYAARTTILPPQQNTSLSAQILDSLSLSGVSGASGGGLSGLAAGVLGIKSPADQYIGMLTGDTIFDRIIERFNLRDAYDEDYIEDVRKALSKRAKIEVNKEGLISIEVTDEDPQKAAAMANAFAEELDHLLQEIKRRDAASQLAFLEKEREQASRNLSQAEERLRQFSEKNSVVQIDAQAKGMIEYIATLRATIDAREVQIQVLRQQATPFNYDLIMLETEIKGLREKLRAAEGKMEQACLGDVCLSTDKMPTLGLEYFRLFREVKYQETLYQLYLKICEIARLDVAGNFATVQFVDQAKVPEKKSKPKRLLIISLIAFISLFMMIGFAFLKEYWLKKSDTEAWSQRLDILSAYWQSWAIKDRLLSPMRFIRRKKRK